MIEMEIKHFILKRITVYKKSIMALCLLSPLVCKAFCRDYTNLILIYILRREEFVEGNVFVELVDNFVNFISDSFSVRGSEFLYQVPPIVIHNLIDRVTWEQKR